jgi:hypothetical protein
MKSKLALPAAASVFLLATNVLHADPQAEKTMPGQPVVPVSTQKGFPAPAPQNNSEFGKNIARSMTLMATSTPQKRNTVRVLFYGQSITQQDWWKIVADDLRRRFPHTNFIIENRALGGFASQFLHKTAEFDLYPWQPDLLIFHVYGSHVDYETIIKNVRQRTTADILIQNDHPNRDENLSEETEPSKLAPNNWHPWFNFVFLRDMAQKYNAELCDQRTPWKNYLRENQLKPRDVQTDGVHLNKHGEFLMAELVKPYLRYDARWKNAIGDGRVRDFKIGKDMKWQNDKLVLPFSGNRVDIIWKHAKTETASPMRVLIDGEKPSQKPELYVFTRPSGTPHIHWPGVIHLRSQSPLQDEDWTLKISEMTPDGKSFKFQLVGSKTGDDGQGASGEKFVSKSGRVIISPDDWHFARDFEVLKKPMPATWELKWRSVLMGKDEAVAPRTNDTTIEYSTVLAQGLKNRDHILELSAGSDTQKRIAAIRVYQPPLR